MGVVDTLRGFKPGCWARGTSQPPVTRCPPRAKTLAPLALNLSGGLVLCSLDRWRLIPLCHAYLRSTLSACVCPRVGGPLYKKLGEQWKGWGVSRQEGWLGTLTFLGQSLFIHTETLPPASRPWDSVSCTVFMASLRAVCSIAGVEQRSWKDT